MASILRGEKPFQAFDFLGSGGRTRTGDLGIMMPWLHLQVVNSFVLLRVSYGRGRDRDHLWGAAALGPSGGSGSAEPNTIELQIARLRD
jgi:hypothetical protein